MARNLSWMVKYPLILLTSIMFAVFTNYAVRTKVFDEKVIKNNHPFMDIYYDSASKLEGRLLSKGGGVLAGTSLGLSSILLTRRKKRLY